MTDTVETRFHLRLIRFLDRVKHISGLMSPAALKRNLPVDQREGGQQSFASIDDDEFERLAFEAPLIQAVQEPLPGRLGFPVDLTKIDDLFLPIGFDPQGNQNGAFLSAGAGLTLDDDPVEKKDLIEVGEGSSVVSLDGLIEGLGDLADGGGADPFAQDGQKGLPHLPSRETQEEGHED